MKLTIVFIPVMIFVLAIPATSQKNHTKDVLAPTGLLITGVGIGTIWTLELISGKNIDSNENIFQARDKGTNQILWPHLLAEYSTAAAAFISAVGLYRNDSWARSMTLITSGLLAYTSINSMSWVLSEKEKSIYAIPMMIGLTTAGVSIIAVF